jgi:hypothetical protein
MSAEHAKAVKAAIELANGLRGVGVKGPIVVALATDDGEHLAELCSPQVAVRTRTADGGAYNSIELAGVRFEWPALPEAE